jgi:hypothetical protein
LVEVYHNSPHLKDVANRKEAEGDLRGHALNPKLCPDKTLQEEYWTAVFNARNQGKQKVNSALTKVVTCYDTFILSFLKCSC